MEDIKLDRSSKILFIVVGLLILLSVSAAYYKFVVERDFVVIDDLDEMEELEE